MKILLRNVSYRSNRDWILRTCKAVFKLIKIILLRYGFCWHHRDYMAERTRCRIVMFISLYPNYRDLSFLHSAWPLLVAKGQSVHSTISWFPIEWKIPGPCYFFYYPDMQAFLLKMSTTALKLLLRAYRQCTFVLNFLITRVANEYSNIQIFEYVLLLNEYSLFEYLTSRIRPLFIHSAAPFARQVFARALI